MPQTLFSSYYVLLKLQIFSSFLLSYIYSSKYIEIHVHIYVETLFVYMLYYFQKNHHVTFYIFLYLNHNNSKRKVCLFLYRCIVRRSIFQLQYAQRSIFHHSSTSHSFVIEIRIKIKILIIITVIVSLSLKRKPVKTIRGDETRAQQIIYNDFS